MNDLRARARFIRRADVIRCTAGRFFICRFVKRNGTERTMVARCGVHKHTNGKGLKYDPADFDMLTVWDAANKGYRMINLSTLLSIRCGDYSWERDD